MNQLTFFDAPAAGEYELPLDAKIEHCRSCDALIVWGRTNNGLPIPLNVSPQRIIGGKSYAQTHYSTCPHAREWRRH